MNKVIFYLDEGMPDGVYWLVDYYEKDNALPIDRYLIADKTIAIEVYQNLNKFEEWSCSERILKAPRKVYVSDNKVEELH